MSFKEINNQDSVLSFLLASYKAGRVAGSYLFICNEALAAAKTAKEFAKLINCKNVTSEGVHCDECLQCRKIQDDKHIDVHWYRPINNTITIAQARDLEKYMYLRPYEVDKKIFIICDAQYLNEESSNALLKTIEEPSQDSVVILLAGDTNNLLPTITSRCQKVIFNSIDEPGIKDILTHQYRVPVLPAHFISYISGGSLDCALELKDLKDDLFEKRTHILNSIYFNKFSLFRMEEFNIKDSTQKRKRISLLLDMLLAWFRDLLVLKFGLDTPLINLDKKEDLGKLSSKYNYQELIKNINCIAVTKHLINTNNINVKLAVSKMRADLCK